MSDATPPNLCRLDKMDSPAIQFRTPHYYNSFTETARTLPPALQIFLQVNELYKGNIYAYRDSEYVFHFLFGAINWDFRGFSTYCVMVGDDHPFGDGIL